jgi:hypothetical protein
MTRLMDVFNAFVFLNGQLAHDTPMISCIAPSNLIIITR